MWIEKEMTERILKKPSDYSADFTRVKEAVSQSKAIYKGEPVPYLYVPKIYRPEDVETFELALKGMFDIVNRTIELYLESESVRKLFDFDKKLDALIRVPHHYDAKVPMGRFDIFYYGPNDFQFCELNADGASAMNEQKELSQIIQTSKIMKDFDAAYHFETYELFDSWVEAFGEIYKEHLSHTKSEPLNGRKVRVAIVDFMDKSSSIEFNAFVDAFNAKGYDCFVADPRDIEVADGLMCFKGKPIDAVYRRLVTKDLMDRYDEIPGFIEGILAGKTCVVGSIKTQIVHTKRFFEVLHHPEFRNHLTQEQKAFIDAHVPLTRALKKDNHFESYIEDRNMYIIKPVDYYASRGVCAGSDYTKEAWRHLLEEKICEDFIIQRYAPLSLVDNVLYNKNERFERHSFRTITGLFVYNEKLSGIYVRGGLNAIISGLHSGYTFATFVAREKRS